MRFHKAHLSRRLILDLSADQEKEEMMINRLRVRDLLLKHENCFTGIWHAIRLREQTIPNATRH
jgi:cullin-5